MTEQTWALGQNVKRQMIMWKKHERWVSLINDLKTCTPLCRHTNLGQKEIVVI